MNEYDAKIIIQNIDIARFFEECSEHYKDIKKLCNWINGSLLQELNARKSLLNEINLEAAQFAKLIQKIDEDVLSNLAAKDALKFMIDTGKTNVCDFIQLLQLLHGLGTNKL